MIVFLLTSTGPLYVLRTVIVPKLNNGALSYLFL